MHRSIRSIMHAFQVKSSKPNYLKPGTTATKGRNQDTKSKQKEQAVPTDIVKEVAIDDLIRYNAFLPVKALQQVGSRHFAIMLNEFQTWRIRDLQLMVR